MILHIDMDAFYAAIEQRDRPELRGRPVVVGGTPEGRGVVAAASYAARRYGIHSAMPAAQAKRLCPQTVFLPGRHGYYARVSRQIRAVFQRYTPLVEPLSLDEAFLDVTDSKQLFGPAADIGQRIKSDIKDELQLTASVGVAANKFVAKVASDLDKPGGFVVVAPGGEQAFLDPLPVGRLWGVGRVANRRLQRLGIETIAQFRAWPREAIFELFGQGGEHLWQLAHGIDPRPVVPDHQAKSISHETTFETDIADLEVLQTWLMELTEQVARRLRRQRLRGRTVQLKLRFADFKTITRARTLAQATDITKELWDAASDLLRKHLPAQHEGLRLLGMGVSGFDSGSLQQGELFEEAERERYSQLDAVSDAINERFGVSSLRRATDLKRRR